MWQHWPGGELLRHPPPWANAVELTIISDKAISNTFIPISLPGWAYIIAGFMPVS